MAIRKKKVFVRFEDECRALAAQARKDGKTRQQAMDLLRDGSPGAAEVMFEGPLREAYGDEGTAA